MFTPDTDITTALQSRIDQLAETGGGTVTIPPGSYHCRPIELKSHIRLQLDAGARLIASPRREDYFPIGYDHNEMGAVHSAIYAMDQEDIVIAGDGEIDLNGRAFYHLADPTELPSVGPEVTASHLAEAPRTYDWRPNQPIFFHQCRNIRFQGVRIRNAPCWTTSFNFCEIVRISDLVIENGLDIPNSDGMHFTGSRDIIIDGCHVTAGDDCVALSSITDWSRPCENAVITNCVFQSASKAISIGYMHSIVRNVVIENVIVKKSNRAYVTMVHPGTGLVENVRVANCIFEGRNYGGNWWGNGEPIVIMATPHHIERYRDPLPEPRFDTCVRNVEFAGMTCRAERPIAVVASEPLIEDVRLRGITVEIVPEELPSLMGDVIDLSPGVEHFAIPADGAGVVTRQCTVDAIDVRDAHGAPVHIHAE